MKKSLIALTLAALPVAAMADVTLYGTIKAGVEVSRTKTTEGNVSTKDRTATEIADFGSKIGFKGHEHLGNNLNAIWQVEQKASIAGTDSGFGTRESFIGLEGGFGKIRAGKLNTALKDSGDNVNVWESSDANADVLQVSKIGRVESREISVRYDTPVFAGFSGSVQYVPRDNVNPGDKHKHAVKSGESYHAGLNYENAGFFGQYAGSFAKNTLKADKKDVELKDRQVHRLVAGYDANNLYVSVAGQIEASKNPTTGAKNKQTEVAATAAYRLGNVTPRVSYAHGFKAKVNDVKQEGSQYDQVIVGADYDFSKRTSALVSAGWLREGKGVNKTEKTASMVGLRHKF
ncbi:trimeric porin PorB [Neisseria cinerea]|uniref:Porin n=1 Tax=Neisseria cinerea TaxID=483 RepID=A0A7T3EW01_NEICI|nr:trimeric porin PorB [Neisseria cinerea]QPT38361.1 porin [Neisseria cinerea]SQF83820.1 porin [Neisseria cinerea]